MKITVPTLTTDGYVTDPDQKLNYMFAHMFEIRHDDTYLYKDEVMSMQKVVADYGSDESLYKTELVTRMTRYFERAFDSAAITLTINDSETSYFTMDVDVVVTEAGVNYSLGRSLQINPTSQTATLMEVLNT